jgi:hypothetical protein
MEETLTVLKLGLPPALRSFLVTTNAIENLSGSSRRISRSVTRWRAGDMISRGAAVGLLQAEQHFRRVHAAIVTCPYSSGRCGETVRNLTPPNNTNDLKNY